MVKNSGEHTLAWHPSALRIQCTQQRWPPCSRAAEHGLGRPGPGVHSARLRRRRADLAPSRRPAPAACGRSSAPFVDDSEADVLAHMDFPARHRTKVDSTNPLERLNKRGQEARRCRRHPPQRGRHPRLIGAVLLEANDEWQDRYMQTDATAELATPIIDADCHRGCMIQGLLSYAGISTTLNLLWRHDSRAPHGWRLASTGAILTGGKRLATR